MLKGSNMKRKILDFIWERWTDFTSFFYYYFYVKPFKEVKLKTIAELSCTRNQLMMWSYDQIRYCYLEELSEQERKSYWNRTVDFIQARKDNEEHTPYILVLFKDDASFAKEWKGIKNENKQN